MKITVDLMNRDNIYLGTMRIEPELNLISDYYGNKPVVKVSALRKTIEEKRPTLRCKDYRVLPCNDNYVLHYDNLIMNTKYLRKLREEAHKVYGIKGSLELSDGTCVYVIGLREFSNKEDVGSYNIEDAKNRLQQMRDKYCISRVAELRNKYNRDNKYRRL